MLGQGPTPQVNGRGMIPGTDPMAFSLRPEPVSRSYRPEPVSRSYRRMLTPVVPRKSTKSLTILTAAVSQPFVLPSNTVHPAQLPSRQNTTTTTTLQSARSDKVDFCGRCHIHHAPSRACPRLITEAQIRVALDEVRIISEGDPTAINANRVTLQQVLGVIARRNKDSPKPAQQQQPPVPPQRAPQQPVPRGQPRLVAPVEEDSSESQSDSESGSGSGSDSSDDGAPGGENN